MEPKFEEFFNVLFETEQNFQVKTKQIYDENGKLYDVIELLFYNDFENPYQLRHFLAKYKDEFVFDISLKMSLGSVNNRFIMNYISRLEEAEELFSVSSNDSGDYMVHKSSIIVDFTLFPEVKTIKPIDLDIHNYKLFLEFNQYKYNNIKTLIEALESLISPAGSPAKDKLKLNLAVDEIALLFRLLMDEKIILEEDNTKISNFIITSFSSKRMDTISFDSIYNRIYGDFETKNINTIDTTLKNMLLHLQKMMGIK